jgi:uncharacterized membrane protein YraQ (UPF0718 family)
MSEANPGQPPTKQRTAFPRAAVFPLCVVALYGGLAFVAPQKALAAVKASSMILATVALPLALVFGVMLATNAFVHPARIAKLLGRDAGLKGMALAMGAGILSVGPIYAWYPLLRKLRDEGAGEGPMAVFLHNRAVKPPLLPVMIGYFGWPYVLSLTVLTILASLVLGLALRLLGNPPGVTS